MEEYLNVQKKNNFFAKINININQNIIFNLFMISKIHKLKKYVSNN